MLFGWWSLTLYPQPQNPDFGHGPSPEPKTHIPTTDDEEYDYELYSEELGNEAHELHRKKVTLYDSRRDEEDLKLRELMQAKERAPSTPILPNGLRKASSPDSALYPPGSPPL